HWFWGPVLCELSYRRRSRRLRPRGSPVACPCAPPILGHRDSRWGVCLRQRGQNLESSSRSGSFFRFFVVPYVRDRQVEHASVMIRRLTLGKRHALYAWRLPAVPSQVRRRAHPGLFVPPPA